MLNRLPMIALTILLVGVWGSVSAQTPEENKAILLREVEEVWNQHNLDLIDEIFAPTYVHHDPTNPEVTDFQSYRQWVSYALAKYPDIHVTLEDMVAEEDKVVDRWTITGLVDRLTITGTDQDTSIPWATTAMRFNRFADGKIVESWWPRNDLSLLMKIGVYDRVGREAEDYLWGEPSGVTGDPGDPQTNKAILLREVEEVWNQHNLDVIDEVFATSYVRHHPIDGVGVATLESFREEVTTLLTRWPNTHITVHDLVAEGDKVAGTCTYTVTDEAGRHFANERIRIGRFADGKIVEDWVHLSNTWVTHGGR